MRLIPHNRARILPNSSTCGASHHRGSRRREEVPTFSAIRHPPSANSQSLLASAATRNAGFTLAEVLAALMFMAIVIPVAVQGLRVSNLAGQVGERKAVAARIAESVMNELIVTGQWQRSAQRGAVQEGAQEYQWNLRLEPWTQGGLQTLTVQVIFPVQGQDYDVRLSTLVDPASP